MHHFDENEKSYDNEDKNLIMKVNVVNISEDVNSKCECIYVPHRAWSSKHLI